MESIPVDAPCPRLCYIVKRADFEGFGFNLHAGKMKAGQFIGKVDGDSPAESAGLRQGDRIIEVNGVNVCNENHKQVRANHQFVNYSSLDAYPRPHVVVRALSNVFVRYEIQLRENHEIQRVCVCVCVYVVGGML